VRAFWALTNPTTALLQLRAIDGAIHVDGVATMLDLAGQWSVDVERGPDWLFVRVHSPPDSSAEPVDLADRVWRLLEQQFTYRLVLELDDVPVLSSYFLGQLVMLHKRIHAHDGMLRLSGLTDEALEVMRGCRLQHSFSRYSTREDAVMGHVPNKPR
jgi:anti-anti-sigma regulatory factor